MTLCRASERLLILQSLAPLDFRELIECELYRWFSAALYLSNLLWTLHIDRVKS